MSIPQPTDSTFIPGKVDLKSLGYCSQCPLVDTSSGTYPNCSLTVYSILLGSSGGISANFSGPGYPRPNAPVIYYVPKNIVVGSYAQPRGYVQIVDRFLQSPALPPPPPSPRPPSPPPAPFPPPPSAGLQSFLEASDLFNNCSAKLIAAAVSPKNSAYSYYQYIMSFDSSAWTAFIPTDDACAAGITSNLDCSAFTDAAACAIAKGAHQSIVKNFFCFNRELPTSAIDNTTTCVTDLGVDFGSPLTFQKTLVFEDGDTVPDGFEILISQNFVPSGVQTANLAMPVDISIQFLGGGSLLKAGVLHSTSAMLFPKNAPLPPPPPSPAPPVPPSPPAPPPPTPFDTLISYLDSPINQDASLFKSLLACTNLTTELSTQLNNYNATILVPSNTAVTAYLTAQKIDAATACGARVNDTKKILAAHVLSGAYLPADIYFAVAPNLPYWAGWQSADVLASVNSWNSDGWTVGLRAVNGSTGQPLSFTAGE